MHRSPRLALILPAVALAAALFASHEAAAGGHRHRFHASGGFAPTFCREEIGLFRSLRDGDFDYCRLTLRYVPGRFDCLRAVSTVCTGFGFHGRSRRPQEIVRSRTERIPCPPGPLPPSCP